MSRRPATLLSALALLALLAAPATARSGDVPPSGAEGEEPAIPGDAPREGLEPLVPELAGNPYRLDPGVRPFLHRLAVTPGFGRLGSQRLFTLRIAYNPNEWLGYEASIGHNPGQAVHAALHSLNAIVRRPRAGRFQPYLSAGYGMMLVFPGQSLNADPVTKNAVAVGGGLEFYVRSDLALRAEMRGATVFGREANRDGMVVYEYLEQTVALSFYRTITP